MIGLSPGPEVGRIPRDMPEVIKPLPRLKLQGFNNLTKSLSFNIYDLC